MASGGGGCGARCRWCRRGRRVLPVVGGWSEGGGTSGVGRGGGLPSGQRCVGSARCGAHGGGGGGGALDRQRSTAGPPVAGWGGGM